MRWEGKVYASKEIVLLLLLHLLLLDRLHGGSGGIETEKIKDISYIFGILSCFCCLFGLRGA